MACAFRTAQAAGKHNPKCAHSLEGMLDTAATERRARRDANYRAVQRYPSRGDLRQA
jgi:hypothetical protein